MSTKLILPQRKLLTRRALLWGGAAAGICAPAIVSARGLTPPVRTTVDRSSLAVRPAIWGTLGGVMGLGSPSEGGLALLNGGANKGWAFSSVGHSSQCHYWEYHVRSALGFYGISDTTYDGASGSFGGYPGSDANNTAGTYWDTTDGDFHHNGGVSEWNDLRPNSVGSVIGCALDLDNMLMWVHLNGVYGGAGDPFMRLNGVSIAALGAATYHAFWFADASGNGVRANFGHMPFQHRVPPGFRRGWGL